MDSRRAIIEALGLSPQAGAKLVEALDARYLPTPPARPCTCGPAVVERADGTLGHLAWCHAHPENVCVRCGVNFHELAYVTNRCLHAHYGELRVSKIMPGTETPKAVPPVPGTEHCRGGNCTDEWCACTCPKCISSPGVLK